MPFRIRDLSVLAYANGFTLWQYQGHTDTLTAISAAGYFNAAADMLNPGDLILVAGADGMRPQRVDAVAGGMVNLGHPAGTGTLYLPVPVPNLGTAADHFTVALVAGQITGLAAVVEGDVLAATTMALSLAGVVPPGGVLTVPAGAAAGATVTAKPAAAHAVAAGAPSAIRCGGQAGTAARALVLVELTRA